MIKLERVESLSESLQLFQFQAPELDDVTVSRGLQKQSQIELTENADIAPLKQHRRPVFGYEKSEISFRS